MKRSSVITILGLLFVPALAYAAHQTADKKFKQASLIGTWVGKIDNMPAGDVIIKEDGGKLAGTIVFYKVTDDGNGPKVAGKIELPLIDLNFDGSTLALAFKRSDGSFLKANMKLVNEGEAELKMDERSVEEGITVVMIRQK